MKTIFIDRDGVINKEVQYLHKIEDFQFIEGVFTSCKYLQKIGFNLIIVTNQSGIGRGYYTKQDFNIVNNWMLNEFKCQNINILDVLYCPHKPEDNCKCRKPKTGMFEIADIKYKIDKKKSWLIGDKESDIKAANNFGITNTILVESGHKVNKKHSKATFITPSIKHISSFINY
ncbi:D-glycero-beta-D-manno-heptose 1,7-bisphosphate 7-phosphatase [Tenacibaculum retecalamus]|uniref:D-glycero-beta-D-manno-heptose 1,7-bisphosphate 7-phosphatase n=1 Tax=Tenacibaculum retecalamus TaxID=3018315 RepID=UPI0023D9480E|nr:D-glycero-beta-D-manno-heptose 1,7-bisphosphate 7-phosphatase [Tenacibaculum retecalamus]WBX71667.1 D-glycero-beta-D-manno-heptose 1,7-bisphosphate 7-phosphatase [Tenacibaculum retecalamus]